MATYMGRAIFEALFGIEIVPKEQSRFSPVDLPSFFLDGKHKFRQASQYRHQI